MWNLFNDKWHAQSFPIAVKTHSTGYVTTKSSPKARERSAITCFVSLVSALLSFPQTTFPMTPSLATCPSMAFSPYLSHMGPGMGLMPELLPSTPMLVPGSPTGLAAMGNGTSVQKHLRTDKLEVCGGLCAVVVFLCLAKVWWKVNVDHRSRWSLPGLSRVPAR